MSVVISQSMYFPWVGILEQVKLADVFVHYDDVQFSKGSFTNRVQVKVLNGSRAWMTVPLQNHRLGQVIDEVRVQDVALWAPRHIALLEQSFRQAPYAQEAINIAKVVLNQRHDTIGSLARASMIALCDYFGLRQSTQFLDSTTVGINGSSSQRVLDIVKAVGGTRYVTGHGALNYLDQDTFEKSGVEVAYMQYAKKPYPQSHGAFTPFVTALDLIAHTGPSGVEYLSSTAGAKPV